MSDKFWINEERKELPTVVLKVGGRLAVEPAKELRSRGVVLREEGCLQLIVNMSEVTFIASSGIGALIVLAGEYNIKGGKACFVSLSQPVIRTIELLNLSRFLTIMESEEEALSSFEVCNKT